MVVGALAAGLQAESMTESPHKTSTSGHCFDVVYVVRQCQTDLLLVTIVSTIAGVSSAIVPNGNEHRRQQNKKRIS